MLGREAGQRRRPLRPQPRQDRRHPRVARGRAARPGRQALGDRRRTTCRSWPTRWTLARAEPPRRAGHHDRALRGHDAAAARADPRPGGVRRRSTPARRERPGVFMESEHFLCKTVAGVPLRRPPWFFDVDQQGEGLSRRRHAPGRSGAVGPLPRPADRRSTDVATRAAPAGCRRCSSRADFQKVTGEADFPAVPGRAASSSGQLLYYCNTTRLVRAARRPRVAERRLGLRGRPGAGRPAPSPASAARASFVEVRQGEAETASARGVRRPARRRPRPASADAVRGSRRCRTAIPGVGVESRRRRAAGWRSPTGCRVGHEAHFGEVTRQFLAYLADPARLPAWEEANMLAKYHVTTHGVRLARAGLTGAARAAATTSSGLFVAVARRGTRPRDERDGVEAAAAAGRSLLARA